MKKILVMLAVFMLFLCAGISAQERFTVQSVAGNVEREVSSGKWEAVKAGDVLNADTVIRTRLNSGLVIKLGDRTGTVGAMQRGVLRDLAGGTGGGSASGATGIRIEGAVAETDTTRRSPAGGSSSTAAARASDAAAELILLDE
jgi:hypothetical protein